MKQKYFHRLTYESFRYKILREYFNTSIIINAFFCALLLSAFLYLEHFDFTFWALHVSLALLGLALLFSQDSRGLFWTGFFLGIAWFYWIALSFTYYGFGYLIPLGVLGIGLCYGFLFWICGKFHESPWVKASLFFGLGFIAPFGFNWLDWRLLFINTPFNLSYFALGLIMAGVVWFLTCKGKKRVFSLLFFLFALEGTRPAPFVLPFEIVLANSTIPQSQKWDKNYQEAQINAVFEDIHRAIQTNARAIVFPESALPLYLNLHPERIKELQTLSFSIGIFIGALSAEKEGVYNSTYFFDQGVLRVAHKVILVPFGESIPFPRMIKEAINHFFYGGASDFLVAKRPSDFLVEGVALRNAICFEATKPQLFAGNPRFMVASSNNAWFTPSIQPTLQRLLLKLYASVHNTTIYHSANGSPSEVVYPKPSGPLAAIETLLQERLKAF
ncbi:apolipoprotein N-acyltransferase [Sulfurospirillum sp. T05]|uniref:Apolipoprotein N-acyltransferase n=1 Tax=Sulfurospirillum tamanense TaxID=2813362 RepID=A0ABS2WQJ2_9BACT|nr:apolipoprotein N-acyltransferase [Sulfurospirillum tamanensis]